MPPRHVELASLKPASLFPLGPWLSWAWHGLFVNGHTSNQFLRFCLVGASGVVVNTALMWFCDRILAIHYFISAILAFLGASVNNFVFNKLFTFVHPDWSLATMLRQYMIFLSVALIGLAVTLGVLEGLVRFTGMDPVWANLIGVLVATVSNFLGNKFLAFRTPRT